MKIIPYISIILLFSFLISCNKNDEPSEIIPEPIPEIEFKIPLTDDIIMYEINLRAYSSSGDIKGITNDIDRIKTMGVNVIWLMPIFPIGEINSVNSPYSVKNYQQVNPEFGTLNDLKTLVNKAHEKGIAVILDWVANHTAWDNDWINNTDWYTQDGNGNIVIPPGTNWQDVADLNFENEEMRLNMIEAMKFWIETADIDGFRCDAADMVPFDFWSQANSVLSSFSEKDLIMLAEGGRNDHFSAGFDMNFSWDFYSKIKELFNGTATPSALYNIHNSNYNNIPEGKHQLRFTTNHDESAWDETPMVLFNGKDGALAASVISIFIGGVPLIYDGQEVGITQNIPFFSNSPINWSLNPDMQSEYNNILNFYSSSDVVKKGELATYNHASVVCFKLSLNTNDVIVIVNTKNSDINFVLPTELANTYWTNALSNASTEITNQLTLSSYEYLILKSN